MSIHLLPNQTLICSPSRSKANLLTLGFTAGKVQHLFQVQSKESRQLVLKRLELPDGFQGSIFKGNVRERALEYMINLCTGLSLADSEVTGQGTRG